MGQEKLLTIREAAHYLNISEKEIVNLSQEGKIPAYKIGGVYLRFKQEQLDKLKEFVAKKYGQQIVTFDMPFFSRLRDFVYFNDFYIISAMIIAVLAFLIIKG